MAAPTIVFDLDGTLVDTAPDLVDTLNALLARHDVPPVTFGAARAVATSVIESPTITA